MKDMEHLSQVKAKMEELKKNKELAKENSITEINIKF